MTAPAVMVRPGRELDLRVAGEVMGWSNLSRGSRGIGAFGWHPGLTDVPPHGRIPVPNYSTDMRAAWEVHLAICERLFSVRRRYFAALQDLTRPEPPSDFVRPLDGAAWPDVLVVLRHRMPEAICLAALTAMEAQP
jgi:hypothetical protein